VALGGVRPHRWPETDSGAQVRGKGDERQAATRSLASPRNGCALWGRSGAEDASLALPLVKKEQTNNTVCNCKGLVVVQVGRSPPH